MSTPPFDPHQQPPGSYQQPPPGPPFPNQQYPGQPYPGQPYPGQPYPGQQYPGQQYPGSPPKKRRTWLWVVLGVVAVVIVAFVATIVAVGLSSSNSDLEAGDCLYFESVSSTASDTSHDERDCADADATYEVATVADGDATCEEGDFTYNLVDGDETKQTLCLVPNLQKGSCYSVEDDGRFLEAPCGTEGAVEVLERVDGTADRSICDAFPGSGYNVFETPPRTYCSE